ncbi:hypothetical protein LRS05_09820 [Flavobacterium sp. J372]|uniref:hypothetical protein n=1 Tax=Flavobacterium sp. J372 TaxID=2898436 RepID=UPI002151E51E|nr:hypothetical protein [Flavobacterium sp. J372]MCR5862427.1 hypothetical protein [Flavobacterium sp. J372]
MVKKLKYVLVLLPAALLIYFLYSTIGLNIGMWGINRTIGWAWDINIHLPFIIALLFCFASYVILLVLQYKPNRIFSIINGVLLVVTTATYFLEDGIWFVATVYGCALIIMICFLNTVLSTYNKLRA